MAPMKYPVLSLQISNVVVDLHGGFPASAAHADSGPGEVEILLKYLAAVEPFEELFQMTDYLVVFLGGVIAIDIDRGAPKFPEVVTNQQHVLFDLPKVPYKIRGTVEAVALPEHIC